MIGGFSASTDTLTVVRWGCVKGNYILVLMCMNMCKAHFSVLKIRNDERG